MNESTSTRKAETPQNPAKRFINGMEWLLPDDQGTMIYTEREGTPVVYRILPRSSMGKKPDFDYEPPVSLLEQFARAAKERFPLDNYTSSLIKVLKEKKTQNQSRST